MTPWHRMSYLSREWLVAFSIGVLLSDVLAGVLCWSFSSVLVEYQLKRFDLAVGLFPVVLSIVAAMALGVFRAMRCPLRDVSYQAWLASSPWNGRDRTPFGPCAPHLFDGLPLGVLGAISVVHVLIFGNAELAGTLQWNPWNVRLAMLLGVLLMPTIAFLAAWVLTLTPALIHWRQWVGSLLSWWLVVNSYCGAWLGRECLLAAMVVSVPILAALYRFLLPKALSELPGLSILRADVSEGMVGAVDDSRSTLAKKLSAGNRCLSPSGYVPLIVRYAKENRASTISNLLLLGAFAGLFPWEKSAIPTLWMILTLVAAARLMVHMDRLQSPLSLTARWGTGRWIIPKYDVVFLPSIVMFGAGGTLLQLCAWGLLPIQLAAPLVISIPCLIGFLPGRRYEEWLLTAPVSYDVRQVSEWKG